MRFEIRHTTTFEYTEPVFLEPLTVRLRPRSDPSQRLLDFEMKVEPAPAGTTDFVDLVGNDVTHMWFDGVTPLLVLTTTSVVETDRENPFDFILVDPGIARVPAAYGSDADAVLAAYLARAFRSPAVDALAKEAVAESGGGTIAFLTVLAARIHETCRTLIRPEGDPWPPAQTLAARAGSCRDLTMLFADACRSQGLAARFVSGYHESNPDEKPDLHAWAEVYLQEAGWRAFDPTLGLAVADRHVALAAGPTPHAAAPTSGTFRGTGARSRMGAEIEMRSGPRAGEG